MWKDEGGPAKRLQLLDKAPWRSLLSMVTLEGHRRDIGGVQAHNLLELTALDAVALAAVDGTGLLVFPLTHAYLCVRVLCIDRSLSGEAGKWRTAVDGSGLLVASSH